MVKCKKTFKVVEEKVIQKKPTTTNKTIDVKLALQYLSRVIDQDDPVYVLVLGLASFATANKLSEKQFSKATKIISFYIKKGVL